MAKAIYTWNEKYSKKIYCLGKFHKFVAYPQALGSNVLAFKVWFKN